MITVFSVDALIELDFIVCRQNGRFTMGDINLDVANKNMQHLFP